MASAASFIPELKAGQTIARPGTNSIRDSLWVTPEGVTYAKYLGEGDWSYKTLTLEEIATWTDEGDWEIEES